MNSVAILLLLVCILLSCDALITPIVDNQIYFHDSITLKYATPNIRKYWVELHFSSGHSWIPDAVIADGFEITVSNGNATVNSTQKFAMIHARNYPDDLVYVTEEMFDLPLTHSMPVLTVDIAGSFPVNTSISKYLKTAVEDVYLALSSQFQSSGGYRGRVVTQTTPLSFAAPTKFLPITWKVTPGFDIVSSINVLTRRMNFKTDTIYGFEFDIASDLLGLVFYGAQITSGEQFATPLCTVFIDSNPYPASLIQHGFERRIDQNQTQDNFIWKLHFAPETLILPAHTPFNLACFDLTMVHRPVAASPTNGPDSFISLILFDPQGEVVATAAARGHSPGP